MDNKYVSPEIEVIVFDTKDLMDNDIISESSELTVVTPE